MNKLLYFEPLFSDRREKLINMCISLEKQGKNFIYILPSREAIRDVRYKLLESLGGIINSNIIMFDELEHLILLQDKINSYISFIESGQVYNVYLDAKLADGFIFELEFKYKITENCKKLLDVFRKSTQGLRIDIKVNEL